MSLEAESGGQVSPPCRSCHRRAGGLLSAEPVPPSGGAMQYQELAERLEKVGRPIPVLGLRRIESEERRVDADDLVALAIVLNVSPVRLLMPYTIDEDDRSL